MKPEEFANATIEEIDALVDGYVRRYQRLEDLFIVHCALPAYRSAYGNKAPTYEELTANRHKHTQGHVGQIDEETEAYWLPILNGGIEHVEKPGNESRDQDAERKNQSPD